MNKLTDKQVRAAKTGLHGDGSGLFLRVQGDARSWVFIYQREKRRRNMGLGSYPTVSLALAREFASVAREQIARGLDPLDERKRANPPTFEVMALKFVDANAPNWTPNVTERYRSFIAKHLGALNAMTVDKIETPHVVATLKPLWGTPTGAYVRSAIERILNYATVSGYRAEGPNPARFKGHIALLLPQKQTPTEHHAAMPFADVPAYYKRLLERRTFASRALQFTILIGLRQAETRLLRWREVRDDHIEIEAERYKARKAFRAPLSAPARVILDAMRAINPDSGPDDLVFPGRDGKSPLSHRIFAQTMDFTGAKDFTVHGFRSSFADWALKQGNALHVVDMCLGHLVGSKVSRAYLRTDMLDERRSIIDAWAEYIKASPAS
ncbi:integrase arm-type DNA-binding domain-containing protein [Aquibium sp. LZ166]|uniref:Integrase arm-type DNA-binding domain-containing protein n=1 Tax=Aquibium pacificus TaxID=3153579 RepID=A0ABV3SMK7_9HYPH